MQSPLPRCRTRLPNHDHWIHPTHTSPDHTHPPHPPPNPVCKHSSNKSSPPAPRAQSLDTTQTPADLLHTCKPAPELNTTRYVRTCKNLRVTPNSITFFSANTPTVPKPPGSETSPDPVPLKHPKPHAQISHTSVPSCLPSHAAPQP